jgi:ankyrin repeat protein
VPVPGTVAAPPSPVRHAEGYTAVLVSTRRDTSVPGSPSDALLLDLIRAIADLDVERASAILDRNPSLAVAALVTGATRADPESLFFERISHHAYAGDTALHLAAAAWLPAVVTQLLGCGARVAAANRRGAQPLHYASEGNPTSGRSNDDDQAAVIRALVSHGADPNALDRSGVAPIHRAVRCRRPAALEALLAGGANPRLRNGSGSTPLHLAVLDTGRIGGGLPESREAQRRVIRILLAHGATPDDRDSRGRAVSEGCDPRLLAE